MPPKIPQQQQPTRSTEDSGSNDQNTRCSKNSKWILAGVFLVAVAIISGVLGAVLSGGGGGDDDDEIDNRNAGNETTSEGYRTPIPNTAELIRSMDLYLRDGRIESIQELYGSIEDWDVSRVTDFSQLLDARGRNPSAATFNANISQWDVSAAISTYAMFRGLEQFNQGKQA